MTKPSEFLIDVLIGDQCTLDINVSGELPPIPKPKPKRVYLAGPIGGIENAHVAFDVAKEELEAYGYRVYSPVDYERFKGNSFKLSEAMGEFFKIISSQTDVVCVLPGWRKSKGACLEVAFAMYIGVAVREYVGPDEIYCKTAELRKAVCGSP
jgi:hypothetical protein